MKKTGIPYATVSFNPFVGCAGCELGEACWAIGMARRQKYAAQVLTEDRKRWNGKVIAFDERFDEPYSWRDPQVVATCFMGDVARATGRMVRGLFSTMKKTPQHQFMVLTKDPVGLLDHLRPRQQGPTWMVSDWCSGSYRVDRLNNVWLGVTATDQRTYDSRVSVLCDPQTGWPGNKWLSCEPMLGPINGGSFLTECLKWCIICCASGPQRQPMEDAWAEGLVEQCLKAQVPVYYKQQEVNGKVIHGPAINGKQYLQYPPTIGKLKGA